MKYIEGDLFQVIEGDHTGPYGDSIAIPHVVNTSGVMGAGFVIPLRRKWPDVFARYADWHEQKKLVLGDTQFVQVSPLTDKPDPLIVVCNMIAQNLGDGPPNRPRPLWYNALSSCMDKVADELRFRSIKKIYAPAFGSALAGGNWAVISELIEDCWYGLDVTICYRPGEDPRSRM